MSYVTEAELGEIAPDLRALARVETSVEVRDALKRLADRYEAMGDGWETPERVTLSYEFMA